MTRRSRSRFVCQECGAEHPRWAGKCDDCGTWNSLVEELESAARPSDARRSLGGSIPTEPAPLASVKPLDCARLGTGIDEVDRVLGGGLVPGSVVLIAGEPGIGKSTLCLTLAAYRAAGGMSPLYVSAEESAGQVALRAERLALPEGARDRLLVFAEDRLERVLDLMLDSKDSAPDLVVVDSIQTLRKDALVSAAGSVAQVRECAADLVAAARRSGVPVILIGHVTKDGSVAGPRVLEHLVDAVLTFEVERDSGYAMLRAAKNRHGPTGEIAVLAMGERGLAAVDRPERVFLGAAQGLPGTVVAATLEGSRVFLVEIQALTSPATGGAARAKTSGFDPARAQMLQAVLTRRAGVPLADQDLHVNVAGGFEISDPGADLAVCLAILSSFRDRPVVRSCAVFGEVGLAGEVRPVRRPGDRLREIEAAGLSHAALPASTERAAGALEWNPIARVEQLIDLLR